MIFLTALVPRLTYLLTTEPLRSSDERNYRTLAQTFRTSGTLGFEAGEPSALDPPLYPIFLSVFEGGVPEEETMALFVQALLAAAAAGLVFLLGVRLGGWIAGWCGGLLAAFYVPMMVFPANYLTETLGVVLLLLTLWWMDEALRTGGLKFVVLAGIALAGGALTRSATLPLVVVSAGFLIFGPGRWNRRILQSCVLMAVFGVVYCPWILRNCTSLQQCVVATEQGPIVKRVAYMTAELIEEGHSFVAARRLVRGDWGKRQSIPEHIELPVLVRHVAQRSLIILEVHPALDRPKFLPGTRLQLPAPLQWLHHLWLLALYIGIGAAVVCAFRRRSPRLLHAIFLPAALLAVHALIHAIPRYQVLSFSAWTVAAGIGWAFLLRGLFRRSEPESDGLQTA